MTNFILISLLSTLFVPGSLTLTDYSKISKNTQPPVTRVYKPFNIEDTVSFTEWAATINTKKDD